MQIFEATIAHNFAPNRFALPSLICSFVAPQTRSRRALLPFGVKRYMTASITTNIFDMEYDHIMGTQYKISMTEQKKKWISISFDALDDTTSLQNSNKQKVEENEGASCKSSTLLNDSATQIPESVLQYQRQLRKIRAADRASKTNVNIDDHLRTVYFDDHVVVTDKPSGILCVPGVNKNRSLLDLVFEVYGEANEDANESSDESLSTPQMIVHRLDMDTSGIVIWARTRLAMSKLHQSFRERTGTKKIYEALLIGWLDIDRWIEYANVEDAVDKNNVVKDTDAIEDSAEGLGGGEINLSLQRDHRHPPFMRVSTPESEAAARQAVQDLNHAGYKKLMAKKPKASTTQFRILSHEKWNGYPVTRVELIPITGRTHQLRVHCAAMGHPILGDPAYGFFGEAHPNGGFNDTVIREMSPTCASFDLRKDVENAVQEHGRTMCLHARKLTLDHPIKNDQVSFEVSPSF